MFIVIKKKVNTNKWHYPDEPKKFSKSFSNPNNNQELVVENNSGKTLAELSIDAGYAIVEYIGFTGVSVEIVITAITGAIRASSDFAKATAYENTTITIDGTLAIPDQAFALPIRRNDGRLFLFGVDVVNGAFSAKINFPTSGAFVYSDEEANIDLPYKMFTVNTVKFDVLRRVM